MEKNWESRREQERCKPLRALAVLSVPSYVVSRSTSRPIVLWYWLEMSHENFITEQQDTLHQSYVFCFFLYQMQTYFPFSGLNWEMSGRLPLPPTSDAMNDDFSYPERWMKPHYYQYTRFHTYTHNRFWTDYAQRHQLGALANVFL